MQPLTIKIPIGLITELAQQRNQVVKYETHRCFKAMAFYLMARSLTTSNGLYRQLSHVRRHADGRYSWSHLHKQIGKQVGISFNTVAQLAQWAIEHGFMSKDSTGYKFVAIEKIMKQYRVYCPEGEISYQQLTINPEVDSLEHILKTQVFSENYAKQQYAVLKKIEQIPGIVEKLNRYIGDWQQLHTKQLLARIVEWQKKTFTDYQKGTEAYDLFHGIHADITLSVRKIREHFNYKSRASAMYLKQMLASLQYITVESRKIDSATATRYPHQADGKPKAIYLQWLPKEQVRRWLMPDLITINPIA